MCNAQPIYFGGCVQYTVLYAPKAIVCPHGISLTSVTACVESECKALHANKLELMCQTLFANNTANNEGSSSTHMLHEDGPELCGVCLSPCVIRSAWGTVRCCKKHVHRECLYMWLSVQRTHHNVRPSCPFCRSHLSGGTSRVFVS